MGNGCIRIGTRIRIKTFRRVCASARLCRRGLKRATSCLGAWSAGPIQLLPATAINQSGAPSGRLGRFPQPAVCVLNAAFVPARRLQSNATISRAMVRLNLCPAGTYENSPPFQRWVRRCDAEKSRQGRQKGQCALGTFFRSCRSLLRSTGSEPTVKTVGYFQPPSRARHGKS